MNILVTGCAGFIGSSLCDELIKNNNIIGIDNFDDYYSKDIKDDNIKSLLNNKKFKLFQIDIRDKENIENIFKAEKIDVVVHLAACAGVRNSFLFPDKYYSTNVVGTINIIECMKKYFVKKMIFASSSSVYGNSNATIFSENIKDLSTISPYAQTKKICEEKLEYYSKAYGINIVCLRFFTVYGPRQRPDLAIHKFAKCILEDKPITLYGDGTTFRDYTFIKDILNGIIAAINYDKTPFEIINLGSSNPIRLDKLVQLMEKELNKKAIIEYLPNQQGDVVKTYADISKAKRLLNYSPNTSFEEGLRIFVEYLLKLKTSVS